MSGLRLDSKHGVNPSMVVCFWCGEPDSLVLFGKLTSSTKEALGSFSDEAPRYILQDTCPCQACLKFAEDGYVTLRAVNATEEEMDKLGVLSDSNRMDVSNNLKKIHSRLHPAVWRVKLEAFHKLFKDADTSTTKSRFVMTSMDVINAIGLPTDEAPVDVCAPG